MSFFKDLVAEMQKEFDAATAEFKGDWQKSMPGFKANTTAQSSQMQHGFANQQTAPPSSNRRHGDTSGVTTHPVSTPTSPTSRNRPAEQRPQPPKKRRKKPPPQQVAATTHQTTQQQAQMKKATFIHPHKLVANLNPAVARSSIIMSEVLGPPVSKRQRRGWH